MKLALILFGIVVVLPVAAATVYGVARTHQMEADPRQAHIDGIAQLPALGNPGACPRHTLEINGPFTFRFWSKTPLRPRSRTRCRSLRGPELR